MDFVLPSCFYFINLALAVIMLLYYVSNDRKMLQKFSGLISVKQKHFTNYVLHHWRLIIGLVIMVFILC